MYHVFVIPKGVPTQVQKHSGPGLLRGRRGILADLWVLDPITPIGVFFAAFSGGIYLVVRTPTFKFMNCASGRVVSPLGLFVSSRGRHHKGKRSGGERCHEHEEVLSASWWIVGRTSPIQGHFVGLWGYLSSFCAHSLACGPSSALSKSLCEPQGAPSQRQKVLW